MADRHTFFGNSVTLPTSYSPLPDGPNNGAPANRRQHKKGLLIFSGLLAIVLLAAIFTTWEPNLRSNQNDSLLAVSKEPTAIKSQKLVPLSRGKSAGVSEKSNPLTLDPNFPWNNSVLSWQRTAFHFQPERNWMNGTFLLLSFSVFTF